MDQNQTVDNDLQKAIDDITNNTNTDPVFSDPVAAPSSVPEGDTGELGEPVGPFPEPQVEMVAPAPEPIAPFEPINIPELSAPAAEAVAAPTMEVPPMPEPTPIAPAPAPAPQPMPTIPQPAPTIPTPPAPAVEDTFVAETSFDTQNPGLNTHQIKAAALRDLVPILDRLNMTPSQKFNICRGIFEDLRDYTVLEQAYRAASEIADSTERAEALLYLVESIDKM